MTQYIWATGSFSIYKGKIKNSNQVYALGAGSIADGIMKAKRRVDC